MNATFTNLQQRAKSIISQNGLTHMPNNLCFEKIAEVLSNLVSKSDVFRLVRATSAYIVDTPKGFKTINSEFVAIIVRDGSRIYIRPSENGVEISTIISYNKGVGHALMMIFFDAYFQSMIALGQINPDYNDFHLTLDCTGHITDTVADKEIHTDIKRQVKFFTRYGFRKSSSGSMTKAYEQRYVPMMLEFNDDFKSTLNILNNIHQGQNKK